MPSRLALRYGPAWRAVVTALEATLVALTLAGCSGGGGNATGPDPLEPGPDPLPAPAPGPQPQPAPQPAPQPQPTPQPGGITGTYVLVQINNSKPGQMVSVANPDGNLIGIYRFDAATDLTMDALQTFTLRLRYSDDKGEYGIEDEGEFKQAGETQGFLALTFTSATYGDAFTGVAGDGLVALKYDFDGDGATDTTFGFQRVG